MPQDVRLTPDGRYFLAADMLRNGVWVIDAKTNACRALHPHRRWRPRHLPVQGCDTDLHLQPRRGQCHGP